MWNKVFCIAAFLFFFVEQVSAQTSAQNVAAAVGRIFGGGATNVAGRPPMSAFGVDGSRRTGQRRHADTLFILDSSASVSTQGFEDAKDTTIYLVRIIDLLLGISQQGSRVGVIKFSEIPRTEVVFNFQRYSNDAQIINQIRRIPFDAGGATATERALVLGIGEFIQNGDNRDEVIFLFTDGSSNTGGDPILTAAHLKNTMRVTICAVGIGPHVNDRELTSIASPGCVFKFRTFAEMNRAFFSAEQQIRGNARPRGTNLLPNTPTRRIINTLREPGFPGAGTRPRLSNIRRGRPRLF